MWTQNTMTVVNLQLVCIPRSWRTSTSSSQRSKELSSRVEKMESAVTLSQHARSQSKTECVAMVSKARSFSSHRSILTTSIMPSSKISCPDSEMICFMTEISPRSSSMQTSVCQQEKLLHGEWSARFFRTRTTLPTTAPVYSAMFSSNQTSCRRRSTMSKPGNQSVPYRTGTVLAVANSPRRCLTPGSLQAQARDSSLARTPSSDHQLSLIPRSTTRALVQWSNFDSTFKPYFSLSTLIHFSKFQWPYFWLEIRRYEVLEQKGSVK